MIIAFTRVAVVAIVLSITGQTLAADEASDLLKRAGHTVSSVLDFGAKCDGSNDDTNAIRTAAATVKTGALYIPVGRTCVMANGSVTVLGPLFSFPGGGTIKFTRDLGGGKAGIYFQGPTIDNINLVGPGGTAYPGPGKTRSEMDGLQVGTSPDVAPQPFLRGLNIQGFRSAVVFNTNYGHIRLEDSLISNNYYGIYLLSNAGDTKVYNSEIVGQGMAGIACPASSHCLDGDCIIMGSHIGFSPYGIYQEAGNGAGGGFLSGCLIAETHFESVGNGAIKSAATSDRLIQHSLDSTYIIHPGFSRDGTGNYTIAGGMIYAIDVPEIGGQLRIDQGAFPLTPGSSGVIIHARNCTGRVRLNYDGAAGPPTGSASTPAPLLVVDNANHQGCVWASRVEPASLSPSGLTPYINLRIDAGQITGSATFATSTYAMSTKGIQPVCTPAVDPGSRWWVTVAALNNETKVTLNLSSVATQDISFYCHITDQG